MDHLPLFVDLKQRPCLVVGGGETARRKIDLLLRAGANVYIVAPELSPGTKSLVEDHGLGVVPRSFRPGDVEGNYLVIAATNDVEVNKTVYEMCVSRHILINSVDQPTISSVIFPSIIDRSPVLIAVSTGGRSPTLARVVRGWIEARLPARLGALAEFVGDRRERVKARLAGVSERQTFWERIINGPVAEQLLLGREEGAATAFEEALQRDPDTTPTGSVALVGAGPGDPELLTLKGLRLLQSADVVLYDNLANQQLLDYARRDAEKVYVGKRRKFPGIRQEGINALLLEHAGAGKNVVRLKGGDPFIFGRGGEETEILAENGISCIVVPGITAAVGSASYAGIPLTHREVSQSVRFVTGHRVYDHVNLDWPELAKPDQTLVIYMGLTWIEEILEKLVKHGMPATTPAALVEKATLPEQRVIEGTIENLAGLVRAAEVVGPTTIIVGEVVGYRVPAPAKDNS
jgi:uroporphyrin-III C-methyltransferase/precorrin-2 dehydrogenase/sirohydrochlorin ferrochelatase